MTDIEELKKNAERAKELSLLFSPETLLEVIAYAEGLRKDAERYRWLKANARDAGMWDDASIDAAMEQKA